MTLNITATMQILWDLINNIVNNTDALVGLVIIGVVIGVAIVLKNYIKKVLGTTMDK